MNDNELNAIYVLWAEKWFSPFVTSSKVTEVSFHHEEGWAGTDVTPGYEASLRADIVFADGSKVSREVEFTTDLMREIAAAAAELSSAGKIGSLA